MNDRSSRQSSKHKSLCVLRFCVVSRQSSSTSWMQTKLGRTELREYEPREATEIMMLSTGSRRNSSGTFFPGFTTLQLCDKISDLLSSMGQTPEFFTGRVLFMSMFNDIFCDRYDNIDECLRNANIVKTFAGRFGIGQWSFIGPGSEKKWYLSENSPQGAWDHIAEEMLLEFAESGHPIFPCNDSIVQGSAEKQRTRKVVYTFHRWSRYSWYNLSHYSFCQSAQCLRSSGSHMWGIWRPSR